jgi:hypothetical protein
MLKIFFSYKILLFLVISTINISSLWGGKIYTATAISPVVETFAAGSDADYYGRVVHLAKRGSLVEPRVTDLNGAIVIPGTIVMQQGKRYWKAVVDADRANILTSRQDLMTAKEHLKSFSKLTPSGAESIESLQQYQIEYYRSLGAYIQSRGAFLKDEEILDSRTQYAPFEGYVKKTFYTIGRASGRPKTIQIAQLNPIGIKVKMDRTTANKITPATGITIYVPNKNKTQGVYNGFSILTADGIIFFTDNSPQKLNIPDEEIGKIDFYVNDCYPVDYFYFDDNLDKTLCVPKNSIQKDIKGNYVWKAKNRKFLVPGKSFNPIFQVVKEYITPGNLQRLAGTEIYVRSLNNSGNLSFGDAVLNKPPKKIKEGDIVAFPPKRYDFMPNDQVKVEIDI